MLVILPSTILKPAGVFIHALAVTTKMPDVTPPRITSTPQNQCTKGGRRFHPIKYKPRKIASVKKAKPSSEKGIPIIAPDFSIKAGQSRPSSNESTVPDTAPTAKRMAAPLDHRFVSSKKTGRPVRR